MITLIDALLESLAAALFFAMGWLILSGLRRTHETSLARNPRAYATIAIFWASTLHRAVDAYYAVEGSRSVMVLGIAVDSAIFVGLVGYWLSWIVVHRWSNGKVELFRDRAAERAAQYEMLQAALEINDEVVQGLTVAQLAVELGEPEEAEAALQRTLESSRHIVSGILSELGGAGRVKANGLVIGKEVR